MPHATRLASPRHSPRTLIAFLLALVTGGAAVGLTSERFAAADLGAGDRPVFVAISPCRLADTRPAPNNVGDRNGTINAAETVTFDAHGMNGECTLPLDSLALSLNITALGASEQTFLTIWPDGQRPLAASLNPAPDQPPTPNAVNVSLSSAGSFNIFNNAGSTHVVVDVNGYYVGHDHDDRYYTEAEVDALIAATTGTAPPLATAAPVFGRTMTRSKPLAANTSAPRVAVDPLGNPIVAFHSTTDNSIRLSVCDDPSCAVVTAIGVTGANTASLVDDLAIDLNGDPVVAYRSMTGELRVTTCESLCVGGSDNGISAGAEGADMTLTRAGVPVLSYHAAGLEQVVVATCSDATCTSRQATLLQPTGTGAARTKVTIGANGFPLVALSTEERPGIEIVSCTNPTCLGSPPTRTIIASDASLDFDLTLDPVGNPAVTYRDATGNALRLARCQTTTCAGTNAVEISTIRSGANVGFRPSMAFDGAGLPVVAHTIASGLLFDHVELQRCYDESCSDSTEIELRAGSAGLSASPDVTIAANGTLLASWFDVDNSISQLAYVAGTGHWPGSWD